MGRTVSENVVRHALKKMAEAAALTWLEEQNGAAITPILFLPWILDIDNSVKPLYGHQEGAEWGWSGYTTQKIAPCGIMTTFIAMVCNWWNLYVRFYDETHHREAITSRPEMMQGVGRWVESGGQKHIRISILKMIVNLHF